MSDGLLNETVVLPNGKKATIGAIRDALGLYNCGTRNKNHRRPSDNDFGIQGKRIRVKKGYIAKKVEQRIFTHLKSSAINRGCDFDLDIDYIRSIMVSHCPCCNREMSYIRTIYDFKATADRKDNSKGYIKGNVFMICLRCNSLKSDGNLNEFKNIIKYMESNQ